MRNLCRRSCRALVSLPRMVLLSLLLACGVASTPARLTAQVPERVAASDTLQEIRLADGSTLFGRVVAVEGERITVETTAGVRIELQRAQIRSLRPVRGEVRDGEIWSEDPNSSRLFFGPTGRMLRSGEGYFGVFELFFPFVSFAVTDNVTLAGGTPIFPDIIGRVFYLAPKVGVAVSPQVELAAGVLAFFATEELDQGSAGIFYGVGTFGSPDNALTAGAGWGFAGQEVTNRPIFMLGGETRVARRVKLITENYAYIYNQEIFDFGQLERRTRTAGVVSGGIRIFGDRLSADAGLGMFVGEGDSFCCLPVVNFVYNFGGSR